MREQLSRALPSAGCCARFVFTSIRESEGLCEVCLKDDRTNIPNCKEEGLTEHCEERLRTRAANARNRPLNTMCAAAGEARALGGDMIAHPAGILAKCGDVGGALSRGEIAR